MIQKYQLLANIGRGYVFALLISTGSANAFSFNFQTTASSNSNWSAFGSFSYTADISGDGIIDFSELDSLNLTVNNGSDGTSTTIGEKGSFTGTNFFYDINQNVLTHCVGNECLGGLLGNDLAYTEMNFDGGYYLFLKEGNLDVGLDVAFTPDPIVAGQEFYNVTAATAVPFEFSPSIGLLALGSLWGVSQVRRHMKGKG